MVANIVSIIGTILALSSIVVGVILVTMQLDQTQELAEKRIAIEAVLKAKDAEFLKSINNLKKLHLT
jgi:hypothetical protein